MKAIQSLFLLLLLLAFAPLCRADDGFGSVTCGGDVAKALVGKKLSNEADSVVESRHRNLALKDLGGDEISDDIFLSVWTICGGDYMLTLRHGVVRDVLKMPAHSATEKEFDGDCTKGKTPVPGVIVGTLADQPGSDALAAKTAWKLDDKTGKFTSIPADGLMCSRSGIIFPDEKKK
ncbi:MAG TPA: hypothetical protein VGH80_06030 [Xanthomonadaceae bacterium]|jgi:hypothetical protein